MEYLILTPRRQDAIEYLQYLMMQEIPFQIIDWSTIEKTTHTGSTGTTTWQTLQLDGLRIRLVEYSKGYMADHWCQKGHIVHCLEGSFISELDNGEKSLLSKGDSYVVSDDMSSHRSYSEDGVKLLIVDGEFLKAPALPSTP
jgi:hypothetical protein